jgi:DegV family protein with EDD domain
MTSKKKRIRFITDSTCDIPLEMVDRWQITVVPCFINYEGFSYADDGVELVREEFYQLLPGLDPFPTTAAPPPSLAEPMVKAAFEDADHLIVLTVPVKLSSVHNSLRLACRELPPERVTLIDSGQVSLGLGMQVMAGALAAEETGDVDYVLETIQRVRERQRVYAAASTLEYLRRSGRVSTLIASVGTLLQIKPIVQVYEGDILLASRVRTFHTAVDRLAEYVRRQAPLEQLIILHINDPANAQTLFERVRDIAPPDTTFGTISPVIGVHLGPGSVGAATLPKNWRQ